MQVFNGKNFLDKKAVDVTLSNDKAFVVREIPTEVMDALSEMGEESTGKELKANIAKACGVDESTFDGVGIVELRGLLDFLFDSLFGSKSPNETTKG